MGDSASPQTGFFDNYVEETLDPGWSLISGSLIACFLLFACLPCMVSLGSRYERRKHERVFRRIESTDEDSHNSSAEGKGAAISRNRPTFRELGPTIQTGTKWSKQKSGKRSRGNRNDQGSRKYQQGQQLSAANGQNISSSVGRGETRNMMTVIQEEETNVHMSETGLVAGTREAKDQGTLRDFATERKSSSPVSDSWISNATFGDNIVHWFCGIAETITSQLDESQLSLPRRHFCNRTTSSISKSSGRGGSSKHNKKMRKKNRTIDEMSIRNDRLHETQQSASCNHSDKDNQPSCDNSLASSVSQSVMSRLHHDDVSFTEAVDKYRVPSQYRLPAGEDSLGEVDIVFGQHAWWRPKVIIGGLNRLVGISDFDDEMIVLVKTSLPSSFQGFWTGFFNLLDVSLVGRLYGTEEASVFVLVSVLTWLPNTFNYGFCEALVKLVPLALEQDNPKLAGTYLNTCMSMYTLGMIVVGLIWSLLMQQTFLWLGFDNETAYLAQQFAYTQIALEWVSGIGYCVHIFLDVTGHERYSTIANMAFAIGQTSGILLQTFAGQNNLVYVGLCRTMFAAMHVLVSSFIVVNLGWVDDYSNGILSIPLKDRLAVKSVSSLAGPLGVAFFLSYGEWELLTLFARALGSGEVVSWAMLGYIWSMLKYLSDGIADAAEGRCALHLVSDQPDLARLSSYKAMFLGFVASLLTTSLLFMAGDAMTQWITQDTTLRNLIMETLPLIGLGNLVHSIGIISASVLGAQERSGLATFVQFLGNWCITVPLSGIFTYGLRIDLQGLTSAVVLGLAMSGAGNTYMVMRSEWDGLASILSTGFSLEDDPHDQFTGSGGGGGILSGEDVR